MNLEEAKAKISELEKENERLRARIAELESKRSGGRKKHNAEWQASYNDFVVEYENGSTIMEIVDKGQISRRTAYRYLSYYREIKGKEPEE